MSHQVAQSTTLGEQRPTFLLTSAYFQQDGFMLPREAEAGGEHSPKLDWCDPPKGTRSFVLMMEDLDGPNPPVTHWLMYDIPGETTGLRHDRPQVGLHGRNDFNRLPYRGPCPHPHEEAHRYVFRLFALDVESLGIEQGAGRPEVERAMQGHVLGEATLKARYRSVAE
jgi:hypothetical protein